MHTGNRETWALTPHITLPLNPPHDSRHLACTKEEREATKAGDAKRKGRVLWSHLS